MRNQGYPESFLKTMSRRLRMLSRESNLDDPETVKAVSLDEKPYWAKSEPSRHLPNPKSLKKV